MDIENEQKMTVTEDELYEYLRKQGVKLIRLSELTGINEAAVNSCFRHHKNNNGVPRHFNQEQVTKINEALPLLAAQLRQKKMKFDRERAKTNRFGTAYDKGLIEPMKRIGEYLNLTALTERVLGWSKAKKDGVLVAPTSKYYGHISEADVRAVNTELLSVAGVLAEYELELWTGDSSSSSDAADEPTEPKPTRRRRAKAADDGAKPWADASLPLAERTRLYKAARPEGVLIYRADGGYAAAEDDARLMAQIDPTVRLDTQTASGYVTAYMTAQQWSQIMRRLLSDGKRVAFTGLYA